jgi:hypothetical protein
MFFLHLGCPSLKVDAPVEVCQPSLLYP